MDNLENLGFKFLNAAVLIIGIVFTVIGLGILISGTGLVRYVGIILLLIGILLLVLSRDYLKEFELLHKLKKK